MPLGMTFEFSPACYMLGYSPSLSSLLKDVKCISYQIACQLKNMDVE